MKATIINAIESVLLIAALLTLLSVPCDNLCMSEWLTSVAVTKGISSACFMAIVLIEKRRSRHAY